MLRPCYKQDRQCRYKRNIEARSRNHLCHWNATSVTNSECVSLPLVIQHAMRMRRIILSSAACLALPYFPTLSHKRYDFSEKKIFEHKMSILILSKTFVWNISHSKKKWARYDKKISRGPHVKYPLFLMNFYEIWVFSKAFWKVLKISNFVKILSVGAELFHAQTDERTDRHDESNRRFFFCNYANTANKYRRKLGFADCLSLISLV
jgi:hypothetical protein